MYLFVLVLVKMAVQASVGSIEFSLFIREHHVYCNVWTPFVVEEPTLKRELDNSTSRRTVTVTRVRYMYMHTLIDCVCMYTIYECILRMRKRLN